MSIKIWQNEDGNCAGLYDSETMIAFGPIFESELATEFASAFARWEGWGDHTVVRHTEWNDWLGQFFNVEVSFLCDCGNEISTSVGSLHTYEEKACDSCLCVYDACDLLEKVQ